MYKIKQKTIILASTSVSRKTLLERANIDFSVKSSFVDEESIRQSAFSQNITMQDCTILLAEMKGIRIAQQFPHAFVISSDQMLEFEGRYFSKPKTLENAQIQLLELQGNTHILHTSVVVFSNGRRIWHYLSSSKVTLRRLTKKEIEDYIGAIGESALHTPGCYQIENQGCHIISTFTGTFYDIIGLPLLPLLEFLRLHGLAIAKEA